MSGEGKHTNSTLIKPVSEPEQSREFLRASSQTPGAEVPGAGIPAFFQVLVQVLEPHLPQELSQFLSLLHFVFRTSCGAGPRILLTTPPPVCTLNTDRTPRQQLLLSSRATTVPLAHLHLVG